MDKSSRQLLELINATLDLSRLEVGRLPLQLSDINMPDLIRDLRDETRPLQDKPGISVAWEAEPTLPSLRTDPGKVKIIIKNLVDNAVKFTEKGTVVVAASAREGGVEVRVTDPGIGIAPDALAVIFEPFRQLETSMTRTYGGVGLGLYLVRRLLDLLGGTIAVETEVGKGSTFRVWLKDQRGDHESTEFSGAGRPTRLVPRSIRAATAA